MARASYGCVLKTCFANGGYAFEALRPGSLAVDVAAAIVDLDTLSADVVTAKASAAAAKVSTAAAKVDALAVQTANVATTPLENAIAALEGDGEGSFTLAHVQAVRTQWDLVVTATVAHNGASNAVATTASTADTDAGTAKTDVDALSTSDVSSDLTAIDADDAPDMVIDVNTTVCDTQNKVRAAVAMLLGSIAGSGLPAG